MAAIETEGMPANQLRVLRKPDLAPTSPELRDKLYRAQGAMRELKQTEFRTDHVLHAGMYSRTVTLPPATAIIGVLIKRATLVIAVGSGFVLLNDKWKQIDGYQVLPASANRKQAFATKDSPLIITMLFPTRAKTVEEAERDFTDEFDELLSHRQDLNTVVITEE